MGERPGREISREFRDVVNHQIDHHGWRYDASGKGYPQLYPADKQFRAISIPKTPSSRYAIKRFIRKVLERGGTWPPEGRQQ